MRIWTTTLMLFGTGTMALFAQDSVTPPVPPPAVTKKASPRLKVEPSGRQDFGSIGPRQPFTKTYTFQNTSDSPIQLRVLDLAPGVVVRGPALDSPILPKGSARLDLMVDPTDFQGEQRRNVKLSTDDPQQGNYYLPFQMTVRPDLTVDALRKSYGTVEPHESPQVRFAFERETGEPTVLKLVSNLPEYLESGIRSSGPKAELVLTFRAANVAPGVQLGLEHVKVETNAPLQPSFDFYVDWKLQHPIEADPVRVVILDVSIAVKDVSLRARDGKPFVIQSAVIDGQGFKLDPVSKDAAVTHVLKVVRTAQDITRSLLVIQVKDHVPLKIPLAYLPPVPASKKPAVSQP